MNMKRLNKNHKIAFTGRAGVGKTTAANYFAPRGFVVTSFAGKLKEIARELWPDSFTDGKPRALLQNFGIKVRELDPDVWANYLVRQLQPNKSYAVDDLRFLNEARALKQNGFVIVRILGPQRTKMPSGTENHQSETEQESIIEDFTIFNTNSIDALHRELESVLFAVAVSSRVRAAELN